MRTRAPLRLSRPARTACAAAASLALTSMALTGLTAAPASAGTQAGTQAGGTGGTGAAEEGALAPALPATPDWWKFDQTGPAIGEPSAPSDPALVAQTVRQHQALTRTRSGLVAAAQDQEAASAVVEARPSVTGYRKSGYPAKTIAVGKRPYDGGAVESLTDSGVHDSSGVRMYKVGTTMYNHPVAQAQYGLELLDDYRISKDRRYLDRSRLQAQRLIDTRVESGGGWYYPYPFDFALHGRSYDLLKAPWYSAMAQGQALSLFTRLGTMTGDAKWKTAATATYKSLTNAPQVGQPSVTQVDADKNLWFDEFAPPVTATPSPTRPRGLDYTFNGHMFAVFGVYDYAKSRKEAAPVSVLDGGMTLGRTLIGKIRTRSWISQYCLAHPDVHSKGYHSVHQGQGLHAHGMSGDSGFALYSDAFREDYPTDTVRSSLRFYKGTHTGFRFSSTGAETARKHLSLSAASQAPVDARTRVLGKAIYYRVTAGALKGYWVPERYGKAGLIAQTGRHLYLINRPVTLAAGTYNAYKFDRSGRNLGSRSLVLSRTSGTSTGETAWIGGRKHARIMAGSLAGYWLPVVAGVTIR